MKKVILLSLFTLHFSLFISFSQNLVPNPSFETHTTCTGVLEVGYHGASPDIIPPWYSPSKGSPDYFNTCATSSDYKIPLNNFGYQYPRTGNAYIGILVYTKDVFTSNYREYLQVPLTDTLITGNNYCINFYINYTPFLNSGVSRTYAIKEVGLYISDTSIVLSNLNGNYTPLPVIPQITSPAGVYLTDTLNWVAVSGNYTAHGGEKYITIGNFKNDTNTDTLLMATHSISGSPLSLSYYYIDDVSVMDCTGVGIKEKGEGSEGLAVYPNPANGNFTLDIVTCENCLLNVEVLNILGEVIYQSQITNQTSEIDISSSTNGMYFIRVIDTDNTTVYTQRVIKE